MPKKLLYLLIIFIPFFTFGQEVGVLIHGKITYNSTSVENVHIINKNSQKATVSNEFGRFEIPVKENDTLLFSAIQFQSKYIIITRKLIESPQQLSIILNPKINNLNEVIVKKPKNMAKGLGLPNAGKKPLTKIEGRLNYHSKASVPLVILATLLGQKGGLEDIYYIASGNRKRDRKLQRLINQDKFNIQTEKDIEKIRIHFKDEFFSETIQIPVNEINFFIKYCLQKDIINLFYREIYIEVIDIFLVESKPYLKKLAMNSKILLFFSIIFISLKIYGQSEPTVIYGFIKNDSISKENIHVINKNSQKGTITNINGEFKIPVNKNDTLIFSGIQFEYKEHIITQNEVNSKSLGIKLNTKINTLNEIIVKNHNLSGFLKNDLDNTKLKNQVDEFSLNLPNSGKAPVTEVDFINRKINYYSKGGSLNKLYGWVSGKKDDLKKLRTLEKESAIRREIRELITDKYLIETLDIKKENIPAFIEYCTTKEIVTLFRQGKKTEIIDFIIKESKTFKR